MRKVSDEVVLSYDRSTDDYIDVTVDDLSVQGKECFIRTCNFDKES